VEKNWVSTKRRKNEKMREEIKGEKIKE